MSEKYWLQGVLDRAKLEVEARTNAEGVIAALTRELEAEKLAKQTAIELLNERGHKLRAANDEIERLRKGIEWLAREMKAKWNEIPSGGSFPMISTMVVHDSLCDLLEDGDKESPPSESKLTHYNSRYPANIANETFMTKQITIKYEIKFSIQFFEATEGGMYSETFGNEVDSLEEALVLLDSALATNRKILSHDWIIVLETTKKVS